MKKHIGIILFVCTSYAVIACVLYELVMDMLGHNTMLWGGAFNQFVVKTQGVSMYMFMLLAVVYVLMILHIVYICVMAGRHRAPQRSIAIEMQSETGEMVPLSGQYGDARREEASRPAPELCLSYWDKNGQEGENLRMTFAELRSRGGLTLGQSGHSNLSFGDASMALRHAKLSLTPDGHLSITHLPSGVPNSMRVNGRNLDLGQSMNIEGMAELYLGATHIVIRTR